MQERVAMNTELAFDIIYSGIFVPSSLEYGVNLWQSTSQFFFLSEGYFSTRHCTRSCNSVEMISINEMVTAESWYIDTYVMHRVPENNTSGQTDGHFSLAQPIINFSLFISMAIHNNDGQWEASA